MSHLKKGLIVGSGSHPPVAVLLKAVQESDWTICADGGAAYFREANCLPDLLLGDFDSASPDDIQYLVDQGVATDRYPSEKDETDLELAVRLMEERGIRHITLLGATGSRLDHTFFNAMILLSGQKRGIEIVLIDETNEIRALQAQMTILKQPGYLSLLAVDEHIVVSLIGVKYPLERHQIDRGSSLGVSNEIVQDHATVICHRGKGLLILSRD